MITVWPIVSRLNRCRSAESRHGNWPPRPITPFSAIATMMEIRIART